MREIIFGVTDKINTPYFYDSDMDYYLSVSMDITDKPTTTHTFLTPDGCEILDGSDPEAGLDHNYVSVENNILPDNKPREFGDEEGEPQEYVVLLLILLKVDV